MDFDPVAADLARFDRRHLPAPAPADEESQRRSLERCRRQGCDRGRAAAFDRILPRAPKGGGSPWARRRRWLDATMGLDLGEPRAQRSALRPAQMAIERPCDLRVDMFVAESPLEEGARGAPLAAYVQRVSDECAVNRAGGQRARAIVVLGA